MVPEPVKQDPGSQVGLVGPAHLFDQGVGREVELPRHRADLLADRRSGHHEVGGDQILRGETGLPHQGPQGGTGAEPA